MVRRLNIIDVVEFAQYTVVMKKIKNGQYGVPRYEATIIYTGPDRLMNRIGERYRFTGHWLDIRGEAEFILNHHLKLINK